MLKRGTQCGIRYIASKYSAVIGILIVKLPLGSSRLRTVIKLYS